MTVQTQIVASLRNRVCKVLFAAALVAPAAAFGQTAGHQYTVVISDMDYGAAPSGLKVGDTVVWANHDTVQHTVTARDKSFDLRLNPGQSDKVTLSKAGSIAYYCQYHPNMRGTLTVAAQ